MKSDLLMFYCQQGYTCSQIKLKKMGKKIFSSSMYDIEFESKNKI